MTANWPKSGAIRIIQSATAACRTVRSSSHVVRILRMLRLLGSGRFVLAAALVCLVYANLVRVSLPYVAHTAALFNTTHPLQLVGSHITQAAQAYSESVTPPASNSAAKTRADKTTTASASQGAVTLHPAADSASSPICTGTPYTAPAALNLSGAQSGLSSVVEQPTYYQVYGNTLAAIRSSIQNCPIRRSAGDYHALTAYRLNWSYDLVSSGESCSTGTVRVGLHVSQLLPRYTPATTTPDDVAATMRRYAAGIKTHEDGHSRLDTEYAGRLVASLQTMSGIDCSTLDKQVKTTIDSYVSMLDTANELYDSQTDHGATQGAIL